MRKKKILFVAAVAAVLALTACGKEGGIIASKENFTLPTLGAQVPYKETQPSTQKETQKESQKESQKETGSADKESSSGAASGLPQGYTRIDGQGYYYGYPSSWKKASAGMADTMIVNTNSSAGVQENINTLTESIGSYTLEQYREAAISQYARMDGYTYIGYEEITVQGVKGNILHLSAVSGSNRCLVDQCVLVKNRKAYILTYTYAENTSQAARNEAKNIMMTFTIQ